MGAVFDFGAYRSQRTQADADAVMFELQDLPCVSQADVNLAEHSAWVSHTAMISADDIGTMVVNYRQEPLASRVFNPVTRQQSAGRAGDLAFAMQSRTDRAFDT